MATSRHLWTRDLLVKLKVPGSYYNALSIIAQCQAEGGQAKFNPLNTTLKAPGSWDYNSVPVQNYVSYQQGLDATISTIMQSNFTQLYGALKKGNSSTGYWQALAGSEWGTSPPSGLTIEQWLDDCRRNWYTYAMVAVSGT